MIWLKLIMKVLLGGADDGPAMKEQDHLLLSVAGLPAPKHAEQIFK